MAHGIFTCALATNANQTQKLYECRLGPRRSSLLLKPLKIHAPFQFASTQASCAEHQRYDLRLVFLQCNAIAKRELDQQRQQLRGGCPQCRSGTVGLICTVSEGSNEAVDCLGNELRRPWRLTQANIVVKQCREHVTTGCSMRDILQTVTEILQAMWDVRDEIFIFTVVRHERYQKRANGRKNCVINIFCLTSC